LTRMYSFSMAWKHVPSCSCFRCEDFRRDNGLSCMYGLSRPPGPPPEHNWRGQEGLRDG